MMGRGINIRHGLHGGVKLGEMHERIIILLSDTYFNKHISAYAESLQGRDDTHLTQNCYKGDVMLPAVQYLFRNTSR